jgi:quinolinate synthase
LIPDEYLAQNIAAQTDVKILTWKGHCEVHERFSAAELLEFKAAHPGAEIIAHPECPPEVIAIADFTGSTSGMIRHVRETKPKKAFLVTECSMSSNVRAEVPEVEFVGPCNLCPHMQRITLPKILNSLLNLEEEVTVDPAMAARARRAVERMINLRH